MKKNLSRILGVVLLLLVMGMTVCAADAVDIKKNRVFQVNSDVELHEQPDAASAVVAALSGGTAVIVKEDAQGEWCKVSYQEQTGYVQIAYLGVLGDPVAPGQETPSADEAASVAQPADEEALPGQEMQQADGEAAPGQEMQQADKIAQSENSAGGEAQPSEEAGSAAAVDVDALNHEFAVVREENQQSFQQAETALEQDKSSKIWGIVIGVLVAVIFAVGIVTTLVGNKGKKKEK